MWFQDFFGSKIPSVAVPFFFVISGYLLTNSMESQGGSYYIQLKKRVRTLLVPYLFWCLVFGFQANLNALLSNLLYHYSLMRHIDLNPIHIFGLDFTMNPPLPLWFLRALMLYVIVSPFLLWVAHRKYVLIIFVGALILFNCTKNMYLAKEYTTLFSFTFAPVNILAFTLGLRLSGSPIQISKVTGLVLFALGLLFLFAKSLFKFYGFLIPQMVGMTLSLIAITMFIAGAWVVCPAVEMPKIMRGQSFSIYLLHAAFVPYVLLVAQKFPVLLGWFGFLVNAVVLLCFSLLLSHLLRRFLPRLSKVIFGGR
jgi:peptidoglycan/LPS O-acetylase OafA/YrhL